MNPYDPYLQVLQRHLGRPIPGGSSEIRFNSPFSPDDKSPDRKHHLYVNLDRKKFFDFRSSISGSLSYLFQLLGEEYTRDPEISSVPIPELRKRVDSLQFQQEKWTVPRSPLPPSEPVRTGSSVHQYLVGRGITDGDIQFWKMRQGLEEYLGWVIIPSYDSFNRVDYWVARRTYEGPRWEPKYSNPTAARKYHVAFLSQAVENGKGDVILCEGVFSAIVAGRSACASLGKFVTNNQISLLQRSGVKTVRIALDGDAPKETLDTASRCLRMGIDTTIIPLPVDQDPADMGRAAFYNYVSQWEYAVTETTLFRLRMEKIR